MVLLYCAYARCGFCRDSALSIAQTASLLGHARLLDRAFLLALTGPGRLLMPEPGIVLTSSQHSVPGDCNPLRSSKMSKSVFPRTRIRVLDQTRQLGRSAKQQRSMDEPHSLPRLRRPWSAAILPAAACTHCLALTEVLRQRSRPDFCDRTRKKQKT